MSRHCCLLGEIWGAEDGLEVGAEEEIHSKPALLFIEGDMGQKKIWRAQRKRRVTVSHRCCLFGKVWGRGQFGVGQGGGGSW